MIKAEWPVMRMLDITRGSAFLGAKPTLLDAAECLCRASSAHHPQHQCLISGQGLQDSAGFQRVNRVVACLSIAAYHYFGQLGGTLAWLEEDSIKSAISSVWHLYISVPRSAMTPSSTSLLQHHSCCCGPLRAILGGEESTAGHREHAEHFESLPKMRPELCQFTKCTALIIGNNEYCGVTHGKLVNCENDAERVAKALRAGQFPDAQARKNLNREDMFSWVESLSGSESDFTWFHFSGHGVLYKNEVYLVPVDSKRDEDNIPLEKLLKIVREIAKDGLHIFTLDMCQQHSSQRGPQTMEAIERGFWKLRQSQLKAHAVDLKQCFPGYVVVLSLADTILIMKSGCVHQARLGIRSQTTESTQPPSLNLQNSMIGALRT